MSLPATTTLAPAVGVVSQKVDSEFRTITAGPSPAKVNSLLAKLAAIVSIIAIITLAISVANIVIVLFNACGGPKAFSFSSCPPFTTSQILAFVSPGIWASIMTLVIGVVSAKLSGFSPTVQKGFVVLSFVNVLVASPVMVAVSVSQVSGLATTFSNFTALKSGLSNNPPFGALEFAIPIVLAVLGLLMFLINIVTLFFVVTKLLPQKNKVKPTDSNSSKGAPATTTTPTTTTTPPAAPPGLQIVYVPEPIFYPILPYQPPRRFYPAPQFRYQNPSIYPMTPRFAPPTFPYPLFRPQAPIFPQYAPPPYAPTLPSNLMLPQQGGPAPHYQVW